MKKGCEGWMVEGVWRGVAMKGGKGVRILGEG